MRELLYLLPILSFSTSWFRNDLGDIYWVLLICFYFCENYFSVNELNRLYLNFSITDARKSFVIIHPFYSYFAVGSLILHASILLYVSKTDELFLYIAIILVLLLHTKLYQFSPPELKFLSEKNELSLGYGAALCYYENYLKLILLSYEKDFLTRVRIFESRQDIKVYHKLGILIPKSCKIPKYIDDNISISRCREMEPLLMNIAGIPNRKFNITVYNIRHRNRSIRLGLEYAQPLKALMVMKEKNLLNEEELINQKEIFVRNLRQMLNDSHDSHKLVELIEYDDEPSNFQLEDLLMDNQSIFESSTAIVT